jgi:hypothetical protein
MKLRSTLKNITAAAVLAAALSAISQAQSPIICAAYPTRCAPYSGPQPVGPLGIPGYPGVSPIYTPSAMAPAMGFVVSDAIKSLPKGVRDAMYPKSVSSAVRSGAVDAAINKSLRNGFDPLAKIITGKGPGGSYYTDQAALAVMDGSSPIWKLGSQLSPYARPLERSGLAAARQQNSPTMQQTARLLEQLRRSQKK